LYAPHVIALGGLIGPVLLVPDTGSDEQLAWAGVGGGLRRRLLARGRIPVLVVP
jgi:hypothetical protein